MPEHAVCCRDALLGTSALLDVSCQKLSVMVLLHAGSTCMPVGLADPACSACFIIVCCFVWAYHSVCQYSQRFMQALLSV